MTLQSPRFTPVRMREGYQMREVDDAVDRIFQALRQQPPSMTPDDVDRLQFSPVRFVEGYDMDEVDRWLDEAKAALAGTGWSPGAATASSEPTAPPASQPPPGVEASPSNPMRTMVILLVLIAIGLVAYLLTR